MSDELRHALSSHDTQSPLSPDELITLAGEMEQALIESESGFSHPDWRYVDGLRALAAAVSRPAEQSER